MHGNENEKQWQEFENNDMELSDEDIFAPLQIQFDRFSPKKLSLDLIPSNKSDSMPPKYFFDGIFVFSLFDKIVHLKE